MIICRQRIIFGLGKTGMRIGVNSVLSDESSVVPNCYMNQTANGEINHLIFYKHTDGWTYNRIEGRNCQMTIGGIPFIGSGLQTNFE